MALTARCHVRVDLGNKYGTFFQHNFAVLLPPDMVVWDVLEPLAQALGYVREEPFCLLALKDGGAAAAGGGMVGGTLVFDVDYGMKVTRQSLMGQPFNFQSVGQSHAQALHLVGAYVPHHCGEGTVPCSCWERPG